jgi:hypothetical protein
MTENMPAYLLGRSITTFQYTNWRGETEVRRVVPGRIVWLDDPGYGYKAGWFLIAWDMQRKGFRQFSLDPSRMKPTEKDGERVGLSVHGTNILWQAGR